MDLSKAFDILNFDILLRKLQHYGIDGVSLNLIKSYLTNRFQYVQYENADSGLLEVKTGIPQGSILDPLFFSILINDYLGIMLDANMSWKSHIAMVSNKLSRINGILQRLKYLYPQNILITLYKSLYILHINYGSLVWGHIGESINKIQKKDIRTITYSNYIAHSEPLLKSLNLLKVKDLFNLKIIKFLFNLYHNKLPPYFNNYILDLA